MNRRDFLATGAGFFLAACSGIERAPRPFPTPTLRSVPLSEAKNVLGKTEQANIVELKEPEDIAYTKHSILVNFDSRLVLAVDRENVEKVINNPLVATDIPPNFVVLHRFFAETAVGGAETNPQIRRKYFETEWERARIYEQIIRFGVSPVEYRGTGTSIKDSVDNIIEKNPDKKLDPDSSEFRKAFSLFLSKSLIANMQTALANVKGQPDLFNINDKKVVAIIESSLPIRLISLDSKALKSGHNF